MAQQAGCDLVQPYKLILTRKDRCSISYASKSHLSKIQASTVGLRIFVGPSGTGKSTELIKLLQRERRAGRRVSLFLADHPLLSCRKNVKPGGYMGCRTLGLKFPITDVLTDETLRVALEKLSGEDVIAVDEAQYFSDHVCAHFIAASNRGIDVVVGMPSETQCKMLKEAGATLISPNHRDDIAKFENMLTESPPFPGERHAYQPLYGIEFEGFKYVREDCPERLKLMLGACRKKIEFSTEPPAGKTYVDVGCCSGYFVEGMAAAGFRSSGVDVQRCFIDMGRELSAFRDSGTIYINQNAYDFSKQTEEFNVISTFATIQWIMVQRGYADGLETLVNLMKRATDVFVLEMGYSDEDIYKGKIDVEIDGKWMENVLRNEGLFPNVKSYLKGENGLWRDVFIASR